MTLQLKAILAGALLAILVVSHLYAWRSGWSSHAEKVNREYATKKQKADVAQQKSDAKAEKVRVVTETKYRTVYRDVVKYVQDPTRTVCRFDANAVQLRQSAIDAANAVSLNDE
ncbi:hypothetical protein [Leclercia sp.]|uniref:hypothetical protein n=1 Tax=Leclercia sp. TaxID=1898428 RepID=UPI0028A72FA0|nr:hypothetical protein [Leclercia sp.]